MVSNALNSRSLLPRPPAVCIAPPKPPIRPLELWIKVHDQPVWVGSYVGLELWGDHPRRKKGEKYTVVWDPGTGYITPYPDSENRILGGGLWNAPWDPGKTVVKVQATWVDGTTAFAFTDVLVIPIPED